MKFINMRSKEIFNNKDRAIWSTLNQNNQLNQMEKDCLNALLMAEAEIEELREKLHNANTEISNLENQISLKKTIIWCKANENEDYNPFYYFLSEKEADDFVEENELCDRSTYEIETFIGSNIYKQALNKNK